jgi:hypothetical protein
MKAIVSERLARPIGPLSPAIKAKVENDAIVAESL